MDLRQSTASQEITLGQFLDSTDGDTEENGLTIANTDIKIRKGGGTTLINKTSGGATVISNGVYSAVLDATDTDTVGQLEIYVHVAGALSVKSTYNVLTASAYDAKYTGTFENLAATDIVSAGAITTSGGAVSTVTTTTTATNLTTNNDKTGYSVSGTITTLDGLNNFDPTADPVATVTTLTNQAGVIATGTAQAATSTTIQLATGETFADDEINGATVVITGGTTGVGQSRLITDYVGATDTATVDAWTTTPTGTITYELVATPPGSVSNPVDVNVSKMNGATLLGAGTTGDKWRG